VLSYARGPKAPLLEGTLYTLFARTAERLPANDALLVPHQNIELTFAGLAAEAGCVAGALQALGLEPGHRIGMWATNCAEWIYLQIAAARTGIILVNVNPAYRAHELGYILKRSGIKAIFLHERDQRSDYAAILDEAREAQTDIALKDVIYLETKSWDDFVGGSRPLREVAVDPHDVTNIQYTSGTTGSPKGVLLTHHNLANNGWFVGQMLKITERDRICVPVPMYHCFGCSVGTVPMLTAGAAMILPAPSFDPLATLEAIERYRATAVYGVPTMFIAEFDHPEFSRFDLSSLRAGIMAGAPCPIEVLKRVVRQMHCTGISVLYGQTEASPGITGSNADEALEIRVATVGRALPNAEVKITGPLGDTLPVGEQGELCARGYMVMKGYDGDDPAATARAVDAEGWLHTGDLATMREDGCFRITGRTNDLIIRGGENIYPREVEEFLYTHPKVGDVQVVGLPDAKFGEVVAAWIRLRPGESATEDEIREHCRGKIAHYKVPQYIRMVDEFPMTVTGKIQKYRIRQIEIEQRGLQSAAEIETA
jgi:fatty-acyl-CoA synthase